MSTNETRLALSSSGKSPAAIQARASSGVYSGHHEDRDLEASIVDQPDHALKDTLGDRDRVRSDLAPGRLVQVSAIGPFEGIPTREGHDAVDRLEEIGIGGTVWFGEAADQGDATDPIGSLVGDDPGQRAGGRVADDHGSVGGVNRSDSGRDLECLLWSDCS